MACKKASVLRFLVLICFALLAFSSQGEDDVGGAGLAANASTQGPFETPESENPFAKRTSDLNQTLQDNGITLENGSIFLKLNNSRKKPINLPLIATKNELSFRAFQESDCSSENQNWKLNYPTGNGTNSSMHMWWTGLRYSLGVHKDDLEIVELRHTTSERYLDISFKVGETYVCQGKTQIELPKASNFTGIASEEHAKYFDINFSIKNLPDDGVNCDLTLKFNGTNYKLETTPAPATQATQKTTEKPAIEAPSTKSGAPRSANGDPYFRNEGKGSGKKGGSLGWIIGVSVAGFLLLIIIVAILIWFFLCYRRSSNPENDGSNLCAVVVPAAPSSVPHSISSAYPPVKNSSEAVAIPAKKDEYAESKESTAKSSDGDTKLTTPKLSDDRKKSGPKRKEKPHLKAPEVKEKDKKPKGQYVPLIELSNSLNIPKSRPMSVSEYENFKA